MGAPPVELAREAGAGEAAEAPALVDLPRKRQRRADAGEDVAAAGEAGEGWLPPRGWKKHAVDNAIDALLAVLGAYPPVAVGDRPRALPVRGVLGEEILEGVAAAVPIAVATTAQPPIFELPAARQAGRDAAWTRALDGLTVNKAQVCACERLRCINSTYADLDFDLEERKHPKQREETSKTSKESEGQNIKDPRWDSIKIFLTSKVSE